MANSAAVSNAAGGSDIGDRLSRLGLPSRPYIMEKFDQKCSVHPSGRCFCYEYITLLHRPDHAYRADSPDPETRKKPAVNGSSAPKKKLNLGDYIAKKNSGAHSERRSMERSPVKNGLPTSGLASTPKTDPVPRERDLSFKSMPKLTNDKLPPPRSVPERETALSSSRKDVGSSLKAQKQVAGKRPPEPRSKTVASPMSSSTIRRTATPDSSSRPVKRQRTVSPARPPSRSTDKRPPARRPSPPPTMPEFQLPGMLSPTLPKVIEDALAADDKEKAREKAGSRSSNATQTSSSSNRPRSTSSVNGKLGKSISAGKKPPSLSATPSGRSPHPDTKTSPKKALPIKKPATTSTVSAKLAGKRPGPQEFASKTIKPSSSSSKDSIVAVLRFKRRLKDFQSLCKVSSKRPRPSQDDDRSTSSARSVKRPKVPGSVNTSKATSSKSPAFKSPVLKNVKEGGRDGADVVTPPSKKTNGVNPTRKSESGAAITPANNSVVRDDGNHLAKQFLEDGKKLQELGRTAKHQADKVFKDVYQNNGNYGHDEQKLALANSIDSFLCFAIAFCHNCRSAELSKRPPANDIWRSLCPLISFTADKAKSQNETIIYGFCMQFEAVIRQHLFTTELATFSKTSLPGDFSKAPTPDSSHSHNHTRVPDRQDYLASKDRLTQDAHLLAIAWRNGLRNLRWDTFEKEFPKTYAARCREWVGEAVAPYPKRIGALKCPYMVPLHTVSTPQEAVNLGKRLLDEWAEKMGLRFESRLNDWF